MAKVGWEDLSGYCRSAECGAEMWAPPELQWKAWVLWAAAGMTVLVVVVASMVYQWWKENGDYGKNVGPPVYPFIGSLPSLVMNRHRWVHWATEELQKTPSLTMRQVMPGGRLSIETANPANVEHFLKTRFHNYPKDEHIADIFHDLFGHGIFNVNGDCWLLQRKAASIEFGAQSLRLFLTDVVNKELQERLCPILSNAAASGTRVDLEDLFLRFAFDNVCAMSFGVDPACLDASLSKVEFAEAFDEAGMISVGRFFSLWPVWRAMRAANLGKERRLRECMKTINSFAYDVIRNRRKEMAAGGGQEHRDLLSRFMRLFAEQGMGEGGEQCSDLFLKDIVVSFLIAGREAPALVLSWFFWYMSQHPQVEKCVQEEVKQVLQARCEQNGEDAAKFPTFSWEELRSMTYLHAALMETMRLYHPVPFLPRVAVEDDVLPDGTFVPKGSRVGYYPMAMGRMESIWGSDCLLFKPERWIKDGEFRPVSPYKFPAFHAGPRLCLGKDVAMTQMKAIAAALIPSFKYKPVPGHVAECQVSITVRMKGGFPVYVHPRYPPP